MSNTSVNTVQNLDAAFKHIGGSDVARKRYPSLYKSYKKSFELQAQNISQTSTTSDDGENFFALAGPIGISGDPDNSAFASRAAMSNGAKSEEEQFVSAPLFCFDLDATMIAVFSELKNKETGVVETTTSQWVEATELDSYIAKHAEDIAQFDNQELELITSYHCVQPDGTTYIYESESENFVLVNNNEFVHDFRVDDPAIKHASNEYINILYDRSPSSGEQADYSYTGVKHGDKVDTMLPVRGHFYLAQDFKPTKNDGASLDNFVLIYQDETAVTNQAIQSPTELLDCLTFEEDTGSGLWKVNFDFGDDWQSQLDIGRYTSSTIQDVYLKCAFRINCDWGAAGSFIVPVTINGSMTAPELPDEYNYTRHGGNCVVPLVKIRWGCFHKDTTVTLADGTTKNISEVAIGESLLTAEGKHAMVMETYKGQEAKLIRIETNKGKVLQVTEDHPVLTNHGRVTANKLVITANIHTEDGVEEVVNVTTEDYNDTVYNVDCGGAMLIANGLYAGDFMMQNTMAENQRKPKNTPSPEAVAVMEDLKRMSDDFNRMNQSS